MDLKYGEDYEEQSFHNINNPKQEISESNFINCKFTHCNFSSSKWTECVFQDCEFENADFSISKFHHTRFVNARFLNCKLLGIDFGLVRLELGFSIACEKCDLSYCFFTNLDAKETKFINCKMHEMLFQKSDLSKSSFDRSDLFRTVFDKVNLKEVSFLGSKNYIIDPSKNNCNKAKFNYPEVLSLVEVFGVEVVE